MCGFIDNDISINNPLEIYLIVIIFILTQQVYFAITHQEQHKRIPTLFRHPRIGRGKRKEQQTVCPIKATWPDVRWVMGGSRRSGVQIVPHGSGK